MQRCRSLYEKDGQWAHNGRATSANKRHQASTRLTSGKLSARMLGMLGCLRDEGLIVGRPADPKTLSL